MHLFIVCRGQIMSEIEKCERNKRATVCVFVSPPALSERLFIVTCAQTQKKHSPREHILL